MNSEKLNTILVAIGGLILVVIGLFWPTHKELAGQIIQAALVCAGAILTALYPTGKVVQGIYREKARAKYFSAVKAGTLRVENLTPEEQVDNILKDIYAGLESDGINYKKDDGSIDNVAVAPHISRVLANTWGSSEYSMAYKMKLLEKALQICSDSFKSVTQLEPPTKWDEVKEPQTYWLNHKVGCPVQSVALFHQVLMPLRTVLKIKDTGEV